RVSTRRTRLPPGPLYHFEGPNVPEGYAAWQGTFAGPMLLWIACRATWVGADETDWQLFDLLLANGADVSATLDYLEFQENGVGKLDCCGTYTRLRRMLYESRGNRLQAIFSTALPPASDDPRGASRCTGGPVECESSVALRAPLPGTTYSSTIGANPP